MPLCPTCGKTLDDSVRFCPADGTPLTNTAVTPTLPTPTGGFKPPAPAKPLELPVTLGSRYQLLECRGGGGMAQVYRATDLTLEREVAVKVINPELRNEPEFDARFQREARIASQLADPHIVVVHDFGLDPAHGPYLVMEFLRGHSLRERLQTEGPMPVKAALQLSGQLFLALIHAHERGIIHRDIKPDNVFVLNQSGVRLHVRVLDFGIARIYKRDEPAHHETLTRPGAVIGTPRYMSPEQLAGQPLDARSDLYSAAMVIHEALTGSVPFVTGKTLAELCPEASPALQDLLERCLKQNPKERPASATEVYLQLQELGKASGVLLLPPGAMDKLVAARQAQAEPTIAYTPPAPRVSRRTVILGALSLLAGGLATWGTIGYVTRLPPVPEGLPESLLDIQLGESGDSVIAKLGPTPPQRVKGDPWVGNTPESLVGHVLRPEDLKLDDPERQQLEMLSWSAGEVCVLLHAGKVLALTVRDPHAGRSARGVGMGDKDAKVKLYYRDQQPRTDTFAVKARRPGRPEWGESYRYNALGIGFEIQEERVTAVALYPPNP